VQEIERDRSMARWTPPAIDMCAPRRISAGSERRE
jgi:hypothetical protein